MAVLCINGRRKRVPSNPTNLLDPSLLATNQAQLYGMLQMKPTHSINDLGVIFDSNLTFKDHMAQKINKAYSILGIIKRNFIHMDH